MIIDPPCRDRTCPHVDCHEERPAVCVICDRRIGGTAFAVHVIRGGKAHAAHVRCSPDSMTVEAV